MPTDPTTSAGLMDGRLLERVRLAVRGRQLIDWHYHDSFASFLAMFDVIDLQDGDTSLMKEGALYSSGLPEMMRLHAQHPTSHVLITPLNQNWGAFSTTIPNRTVDWGDWRQHLARAGCTPEMVRRYLDDPAVIAVLATQHTTIWHPKIVSVPVGVPRGTAAITRHLETADGAKTQDLLINNSGWGHRTEVNERVSANFGGRIRNTFGCSEAEYFQAVTRSRFVLCPSGFGWDNYRIWETLTLGSIPVLEFSRGFHTVLEDLPVLWVDHFDQVTPELLETAYPDILSRCDSYDYRRLTREWWVSRVARLLDRPPEVGPAGVPHRVAPRLEGASMYRIYFPLFDHHESRTNEVRLTHEGLLAHPRVTLVDRPELADYLIFCQNHLVDHCPFHTQFRPIKDRYKERTILLDYDDNPHTVFDAADFRWKLYFKRSCVDRRSGTAMHYAGLRVIPTAYAVADDMADPPPDCDHQRRLDIACLFDDDVTEAEPFKYGRGRLLQFARQYAATHPCAIQIGPVSPTGSAGRSAIHPEYKRCLYNSKIVLNANPDWWEGDSRTWEALASGALLFIDRMYAPIAHPLIDGEHLIFYDFTDEGMTTLEAKIVHYLESDLERAAIASRGRHFVLAHHRSLDRVNAIVAELSATGAPAMLSTPCTSAVDISVAIATGGRMRAMAAPDAFIPYSIEVVNGRSVVRWIERTRAPTTLPFFAQMIRERLASGARQCVTGLDALHTVKGSDPVGLVMHLSRSGSTLVVQALAQAGCIAPISEATPVNQLLARGDIDERERVLLLRSLIRALGSQDGSPVEWPSLVKLTSWNVLFLDLIRAAFPETPWLFLYREPLDVLASHDELPAHWLADEPFLAGLAEAHRLPPLAGLAREERCAAVLAAYGRAALAASPAAVNLLNYSQLPAALSTDVPGRFGVATTTVQQRRIEDASRIYGKDVSRRRVLNTDRERRSRGVGPELREAADLRYSRPVHVALERCRTGSGNAGDDSTCSRR